MTDSEIKTQINRNAKISGFMYLLIILSSLLSLVLLDPKIGTIKDIIANEIYFRINSAYLLFMYICVFILSIYLYEVLKYINKTLALLSLSLRLAEAVLGVIQVFFNLIILLLLNGKYSQVLGVEQVHSLAELFKNAHWSLMIIIFAFLGLGSIICFYLLLKSRYIPVGISVWGICSYALVAIGALISIIYGNNAFMILGSQTIIFEIFIGAWLLRKGINMEHIKI